MSHLWPELLRINLCPDKVVLERGKLAISIKGLEPRYYEPEVIPVEPVHEPTLWSTPLAILKIVLDGLPEGSYDACVVLSNHFVHYPVVGRDPLPTDSHDCLIDKNLRDSLANLLERHGCRLGSLQPRIAGVHAKLQEDFPEEPAWLVVVEDGLACFGLMQDGELHHLHNVYMWPAASVEMLTLLDKESANMCLPQPPRNLLIWRQNKSDEILLPANNDWQITWLGLQPTSLFTNQVRSWQESYASVQA